MKSFKEYSSVEVSPVQEGLLSRIVDKVDKVLAPPKPKFKARYGYDSNTGKPLAGTKVKSKPQVKSSHEDDPWLKHSSGAEKKAHYRQLRGEEYIQEKSEEKYCRLCCKKEKREQCGYGPTMWDRYTVNDATAAEKKEAAIESGIIQESKFKLTKFKTK
jgi:hypothetical protein